MILFIKELKALTSSITNCSIENILYIVCLLKLKIWKVKQSS